MNHNETQKPFNYSQKMEITFYRGNGHEQILKFLNGKEFYKFCIEVEQMSHLEGEKESYYIYTIYSTFIPCRIKFITEC